jgi:hypothetical protein
LLSVITKTTRSAGNSLVDVSQAAVLEGLKAKPENDIARLKLVVRRDSW